MEKWSRIKHLPIAPIAEYGKMVTGCPEHIRFSRQAAAEGMVLLKNDGTLPLKTGSCIALFGKAQFNYIKGGTGSGDVYCDYVRSIYDGLKIKESEGKITVFDPLSQYYRHALAISETEYPGKLPEPNLPPELISDAAASADIAIIAICRTSGEGSDRPGGKGCFYLSDAEEDLVQSVCSSFENVAIILNVGGIVDTTWIHDRPEISACILAWYGGMEGGLAVADLLTGDVTPSGKLTDTFAKSPMDYPSSQYGSDSPFFVKYYEDIYVGYRYFETIPGAAERVNYPFGFGLSYTSFSLSGVQAAADDETVHIKLTVTNTGSFSGKEVVQVYYCAPQGLLGKPARCLAAFQKTRLLAPGESQLLTLEFPISSMASYDDLGILSQSAYILEGGIYSFFVGTSVRDTEKLDFTYTVEEPFRVIRQLSQQATPLDLEKRLFSDGTFRSHPLFSPQVFDYWREFRHLPPPVTYDNPILFSDVANGNATIDEFMVQLDYRYLLDLLGGKPNRGYAANTHGMGGRIVQEETGCDQWGIPCAMTCDGPAGARLGLPGLPPEQRIHTTALPCATLLACTWNPEILYEAGKTGAMEAKENNISIWLAPGMNIHRTPLCGRNFEYYSEDPLVTGKMAAAQVRGVQSQKIAACPKHFACNNQESNRSISDSIVSERALREIYLKGFEICVKEAAPWVIMTSYNLLNGIHTSENYALITQILRGEWGFDGLVTTDWECAGQQRAEILAGNDVKMHYGFSPEAPRPCEHILYYYVYQSVKRLLSLLLKLD